jgi:hypothetical protein
MGKVTCSGTTTCSICDVFKIKPFAPPIGADPRYVGILPAATQTVGVRLEPLVDNSVRDSIDAMRYALGGFVNQLKKEVSIGGSKVTTLGSASPADRSSTYIGAELKGAKERVKRLEAELRATVHEENGRAIMMTCPDGSRHKWRCKEYSHTTDYRDVFPQQRRKGKFVCPCGATATIE